MKRTLCFAFAIVSSFTFAQEVKKPTLYTRLGGINGICGFVDEFVNRLLTDPKITSNPKVVEASKRISGPGLKVLLAEQIAHAAGGPHSR